MHSDTRRAVLIDKNVIQGMSRVAFAALDQDYVLLMPDALFYEMLATAEPRVRAACFSKLSTKDNPILLVDHIGTHLRHETRAS